VTWKFDSKIAETFVDHARQHIPNYDRVIDKSIDVCKYMLSSDAGIIDVGCATGETLRRLHAAGFTNLHGVESSHAMLQQCDAGIAQYYHSDRFPAKKFDAVICNWTLHFVEDKVNYLRDMADSLNPGGILVVSDKTSKASLPIHFYHEFKRNNGVSDTDIQAKEAAVEDIMFINNPKWYLDQLNGHFGKVYIIDASWCFTSFLCIK
jgi:tRNA (cmo5U34)-methyltransferase